MEEWLVSWACLRLRLAGRWLDYDARRRAANKLHALAKVENDRMAAALTGEQRELARFWSALSQARNAYAHAGMRGLDVDAELPESVRVGWETLKHAPDRPLEVPGRTEAPVLVSAVGTTPGPLYSALRACPTDPGCLIAICSEETRTLAEEARRNAVSSATLIPLSMADPVGGTTEIDRVVSDARRHLLDGPEVLVNMTGGTTLMGLVVEQIALEAARLGRPVRRFGLIDRRPREEQLRKPYVAAEPYWLDSGGDAGPEGDQ
jgi:hypothetical protein